MPEIYNASHTTPPPPKPTKPPASTSLENSGALRHYRCTTNPLSSFMVKPHHVKLGILEPNEQLLLVVRQHPITLLGRLLVVLIMLLVPFLAAFFPAFSLLPQRFMAAFAVLWYLFTIGVVIEGFISWYYDLIAVTDERIIDIDFIHLIYRNITYTKIDNIEDVTFNVTGVIPSLLNYGNVLIQTAGEGFKMKPQDTMATMEIWNTPNPNVIAQLINEVMLQEEQEKLEGRAS